MSQDTERFVLENASQVETAYLAAWVSGGADELEEELAFYVSVLSADDLRFEATGEKAQMFRRQAIDSLTQVCNEMSDEHSHLVLAAFGLLRTLHAHEE